MVQQVQVPQAPPSDQVAFVYHPAEDDQGSNFCLPLSSGSTRRAVSQLARIHVSPSVPLRNKHSVNRIGCAYNLSTGATITVCHSQIRLHKGLPVAKCPLLVRITVGKIYMSVIVRRGFSRADSDDP